MTITQAKELLGEDDTFTLFADGFDDAFIGLGRRNHQYIAIYSEPLGLSILTKQAYEACEPCMAGLRCLEDHRSEAIEYFEFNVAGAYVGEGTPLWLDYDGELIFQ